MNQYQSISALKDHAKEKLNGKFGIAVLLNLANNAIIFSVTFIISMVISTIVALIALFTTENMEAYHLSFGASVIVSVIQYILTLICSIYAGVFSTGVALFFLNIASGRTATISNLFYGFQYLFKKSLTLSAVTTLINTICLLPYNICHFMFTKSPAGNWGIYMVIALLIGMIIYTPISLSLSQAFFLLLDFPSRSAKEILLLSMRLMNGKKWKFFLIQLSFYPLLILGALSFGIGNLWITPYLNMTLALYFLDIMKPTASKE